MPQMDGSGSGTTTGPPRDDPPAALASDDPARLLNRELSWLAFNARVLELAADTARPILERAKFLAIFTTNLDEFVQVRVSGLPWRGTLDHEASPGPSAASRRILAGGPSGA